MAITLVTSTTGTPSGGVTTTPSINTTGANLLVASISIYSAGNPTVTDSKGNTWTVLTLYSNGNARVRLFYVLSPTVGTGHTFTANPSSDYAVILVYAFSGVDSFLAGTGNINAFTATSIACGNLTPAVDGALIFTGDGVSNQATTDTVSTPGFTVTTIPQSGSNMRGSAGYHIQPTAATINPTWSFSPGVNPGAVAAAAFLPTAAVASVEKSFVFVG